MKSHRDLGKGPVPTAQGGKRCEAGALGKTLTASFPNNQPQSLLVKIFLRCKNVSYIYIYLIKYVHTLYITYITSKTYIYNMQAELILSSEHVLGIYHVPGTFLDTS